MEKVDDSVIIHNYYSSSNDLVWQTNANYFANSANSLTLTVENFGHTIPSIDGGNTSDYKYGGLASQSTWNLNYSNPVSLNLGGWKRENAIICWKGKREDTGIWNKALTAQEITKIYNGEKF